MIFGDLFDFFEDSDLDVERLELEQAPEFCDEVDAYLNEENNIQAFHALDRMTHEVDGVSAEAVETYLGQKDFDPTQFQGLMSNWKGIYGEIEVLERLNATAEDGIEYKIPRYTNNPDVDIFGIDQQGNVVEKYQVKMSLDTAYLNSTINTMADDVKLICPSEVAGGLDPERVFDAGISLESVESELADICSVVETPEPWESELDEGFFDWLNVAKVS